MFLDNNNMAPPNPNMAPLNLRELLLALSHSLDSSSRLLKDNTPPKEDSMRHKDNIHPQQGGKYTDRQLSTRPPPLQPTNALVDSCE
jgi:hypothetical protein